MRGRTKRKSTKEPQDLNPISSPHLEERLIGGNVDLDLLSLFPQEYARIIGGMGRNQENGQALQRQQWRREKTNLATALGEGEGYL